MEPNSSRTGDDIHLIATPFRHIRNLLIVSAAFLLAPVILIWLIIGSHLQPEACGFAKILIGVFGPLIFCVWFAGVVRWCERNNDEYPALGEGTSRASGLAAYFCGLGWVGILISIMNDLTGLDSLWAMVIGLFSPAIIYLIGRVFGMWVTAGLALLEIGLTVFLFGRGFGFF